MKHGFTLIELMIVVAIIAIIAAIAIPSLLRSRMAANETAACAACKAIAEAQEIYHRTDYNNNGILEYSKRMTGRSSLFEINTGAADLQLIDVAFAKAELTTGTPKHGYVFTILKSQGAVAPGGAQSWLINNRMKYAHGANAEPNDYDMTGRSSFIISSTGTIYQADKANTSGPVFETVFNPDTTWTPSE